MVFLTLLNAQAQKTTLSQPTGSEGFSNGTSEVDRIPTFSGGITAYRKFLAQNLKWPNQDDAQGRVIVSFFIEKDGRLTGFKVERNLGKEFDAEAIRVLKKSPKWIPAMKNGKAVRLKYAVPINFTLSE
jgi:protein TonB